MGFDQKGKLVFRVARGVTDQWDVTEGGFDEPLASFDGQKDALQYADDLAKAKSGSIVKVIDEAGHEIPKRGRAGFSG